VKTQGFRLAVVVLSFAFLAVVYVLISTPEGVQAATTVRPHPLTAPASSSPASRYAQAAQALRSGDLQTARQLLAEVARRDPGEAGRARLLDGLYAWEAGDARLAESLLAAEGTQPGGELEDWRLWLLAESARQNGDRDMARATLDRLLAGCPRSPLRPAAFVAAARLAEDRGDERGALTLVDGARHEKVRGEAAIELENTAWRIGQRLNDDGIRREAARRLLVEAPLTAGALDVAATFRAIDGSIDWSLVLSSGEVKERARSFLDVDRMTAAIDTLDHVPEAERDTEWHLIKARALTESRRGGDALSVLSALNPEDPAERASLEWERAVATAEMASTGHDGAERRSILEASHRHLVNVMEMAADAEISLKELKLLYRDFLAADLFPQAADTLRVLRRVDPADTTGTRDLWERGWEAYQEKDLATAVSFWKELGDIYPGQGDAQRGVYWQARALEQMGAEGKARALYRDLVADSDTGDFYRRQAAERLGGTPVSSAIELARSAAVAWPQDPTLLRAKLLTDLGLDKLAVREMDLVERKAGARDLLALRALVMGRQGNRRGSIALLREAFPALGGPRQSTVPGEILRAYYPLEYAGAIRVQALANGLAPALVAGIIRQESAFDPRATSPVGARGLMQLMPTTAREMSSRLGLRSPAAGLYDPDYSIALGAGYFHQLLNGFSGNVELALAGYNGGPNRIRRLWEEAGPKAELDSFVETLNLDESRDYVKRILVLADSYRQLYPSFG
jgi:soluble lytic murein transglycosylase-like protein/thioredoxin-like negative regulator of GroEL